MGGQANVHRLPTIPAVRAGPQPAGGAAEGEPIARFVHRQGMAVDQVVGMLLRQATAQHLERPAAIAGARHHQTPVHRDALLVLDRRHEPGGVGIVGVRRHREAEHRRSEGVDRGPVAAAVGRTEHPVVVLAPEHLRRIGTTHDAMRILRHGFTGLFGGHVGRPHPFGPRLTLPAAIRRCPDTPD